MKTTYFYLAYQVIHKGYGFADTIRLTSSDNVGSMTKALSFSSLFPTKKRAEEVAEEWNNMFREQGRHTSQFPGKGRF